jgi:hypothetical protein
MYNGDNQMKRFIITILTITILLALFLTACGDEEGVVGAPAPLDAVPEIVGSYSVNGFDPLGTEYGGNLTVTPGDQAGAYKLQWIVTGSIQEGNGRLEGNTLQVEWSAVSSISDQSHGTATYTVTVNGELVGQRFVEGHPGEGTETAFPN